MSGGATKPTVASWYPRSSWPAAATASSCSGAASPTSPATKSRISRPSGSMPCTRGAPAKPAAATWRSNACTAGVRGPTGRRTVSPARCTTLTPPRSSAPPIGAPPIDAPLIDAPLIGACPRRRPRAQPDLGERRAVHVGQHVDGAPPPRVVGEAQHAVGLHRAQRARLDPAAAPARRERARHRVVVEVQQVVGQPGVPRPQVGLAGADRVGLALCRQQPTERPAARSRGRSAARSGARSVAGRVARVSVPAARATIRAARCRTAR